MTKTQRVTKLSNAIRAYRGTRHGEDGKWIRAANPSAAKLIRRRCQELGLDVDKSIAAIDGFKSFDEMRAWLRAIA